MIYLNEEEKALLLNELLSNTRLEDINQKYNWSKNTIKTYTHWFVGEGKLPDTDKRKVTITQDQIDTISNSGLTNKQIAEKLNISVPTVCNWKKKLKAQGVIIKNKVKIGRPKKEIKHCPTCGQRIK